MYIYLREEILENLISLFYSEQIAEEKLKLKRLVKYNFF